METVKVDRQKLLSTLRENRASHIEQYDNAVVEFKAKAEKALRKRALEVRDGETLNVRIDMPEPQSFADEYDAAIAAVEWSEDENIVLSGHLFTQYVLDKWGWRHQFQAATTSYLAS